MTEKPILLVDFDGVIHSYTSGWKGARIIPDPPVPGAITFLLYAMRYFQVCVYSSRSNQWGGRRAMKNWLFVQIANHVGKGKTSGSLILVDPIKDLLSLISFPKKKPAAFLTIDDRAMRFTGTWPDPRDLLNFKPWNKT